MSRVSEIVCGTAKFRSLKMHKTVPCIVSNSTKVASPKAF